jgi:hypothetical protein
MNLFSELSDEDLIKCYEQREHFAKTMQGITENPMRGIIDEYSKITANCLLLAETNLLDEIARRWYRISK